MNFKALNNNKGITLMEVIIVLAIMVIMGAIMAPNFLYATERARIRSDIQSATVIQSAISLYKIETGNTINTGDINVILQDLVTNGYLQRGSSELQTRGAVLVWQDSLMKIDVNSTSLSRGIIESLSERERGIMIYSSLITSS